MKLIACALAALGLIASSARADDQVEVKQGKNDVRIEKKHTTSRTKHRTKVVSKARPRPGGGTVSKTETTEEHQGPGTGDSKTKVTETKERDAQGDVVRQEKKVQH